MHSVLMLLSAVCMLFLKKGEHGRGGGLISGSMYIWVLLSSRRELKL